MILIMKVLNFLSLEKIEQKNNICIKVFCYESNLIYPAYTSDQKLKTVMDLLLITDKNKSTSKILTDSCVIGQNVGLKNAFEDIL